jgi:hypothetical protein
MLNSDNPHLTARANLLDEDKQNLALLLENVSSILHDLLDGKVPHYYHTNEIDELTKGSYYETKFGGIMQEVWDQMEGTTDDYHPPIAAFPRTMKRFKAEYNTFYKHHIVKPVQS